MMTRRRYKDTGKGTFMGDYYYAGYLARHRDHFLVLWRSFSIGRATQKRLISCYAGKCNGSAQNGESPSSAKRQPALGAGAECVPNALPLGPQPAWRDAR